MTTTTSSYQEETNNQWPNITLETTQLCQGEEEEEECAKVANSIWVNLEFRLSSNKQNRWSTRKIEASYSRGRSREAKNHQTWDPLINHFSHRGKKTVCRTTAIKPLKISTARAKTWDMWAKAMTSDKIQTFLLSRGNCLCNASLYKKTKLVLPDVAQSIHRFNIIGNFPSPSKKTASTTVPQDLAAKIGVVLYLLPLVWIAKCSL